MASILDKVKVSSYTSGKLIKGTNEVRSNQYVHDYYHITKSVLPKGLTDGVEIMGDTLTDTITGITVQSPWRRKLTRDRLAHALEFEQINPIEQAINDGVRSISNGAKSVGNLFSKGLGYNTKVNRKKREEQEMDWGGVVYTPTNSDKPTLFDNDEIDITHFLDLEEAQSNHESKRLSLGGKTVKVRVWIVNTSESPYQRIKLQVRPSDIKIDPQTSWAVIKSMGRNVPMYHYTGAEDTIEINTSWFQEDKEHPDDVINKCRILESWSKADGYVSSPPVLQIVMGNDGGPFAGQFFILNSASYELTHFGVNMYDVNGKVLDSKSRANTPYNYYPTIARQTLVFKRVSDTNPTWEDIIPSSKLKYTSGYITD